MLQNHVLNRPSLVRINLILSAARSKAAICVSGLLFLVQKLEKSAPQKTWPILLEASKPPNP